jgi:hypothetical protein
VSHSDMAMTADVSPVMALAHGGCEKSLTWTGAYEVRKKIQDFHSESFYITPWHVACSPYRSFLRLEENHANCRRQFQNDSN